MRCALLRKSISRRKRPTADEISLRVESDGQFGVVRNKRYGNAIPNGCMRLKAGPCGKTGILLTTGAPDTIVVSQRDSVGFDCKDTPTSTANKKHDSLPPFCRFRAARQRCRGKYSIGNRTGQGQRMKRPPGGAAGNVMEGR